MSIPRKEGIGSTGVDLHLSGYQARDYEIVDYNMGELTNTGLQFREGAEVDLSADYFACIGAAQTLGCFSKEPFPKILERELALPGLNLGYGGAGPEFFCNQKQLLPLINGAKFVVLQVMSARSQSNSHYECGGLEYVKLRESGRQLGAAAAMGELMQGTEIVNSLPIPPRFKRAAAVPFNYRRTNSLIKEIRRNYVQSMNNLIERISSPIILFWFSKRTPNYTLSFRDQRRLFGEFPHLVTEKDLRQIIPNCTEYIECISSRGSPQQLVSRFTGKPAIADPSKDRVDFGGTPWHQNLYYPSPEMHEDAATELLEQSTTISSFSRL